MRMRAVQLGDYSGHSSGWFVPACVYECGHRHFTWDYMEPPLWCPTCGADFKHVDMHAEMET